ncbi:MAG TPA: hypothetical protein VJL32_01590 [Candidatus Paceibacterota bacterium]
MNRETKTCQNCHVSFTIEPDDFGFYEKIKVPPPTFCADCRQQRRMTWRNDYNFFVRECSLCKGRILSVYSSDKPVPVYCPKCWWSDGWDAKVFSKEVDINKPFFPQFKELLSAAPTLAILNDDGIASENCQYTNYFALGKNCYMVINSWKVEECMYSVCLVGAKNAVDCAVILEGGERLYHAINVDSSSRCRYVFSSAGLLDSAYCYDCRNCSDCFMSIGLRGKKYCYKNRQYTKEEYEKILKSYSLQTWTGSERAREEFEEFILQYPRKFANIVNSVNCSGDYLVNSKNAKHCYITVRVENSKYFERGDTIRDSYDCLSGGEQELCYESINPDNSYGALFTSYCHKDNDVLYSDSCQSSEHLFGCVGLKSSKYCILNKQYTKEEYEVLTPKLIEKMKERGEYGEFLPAKLSPFCYNESVAQDEYPLNKEQVLSAGLRWQENFTKTEGKESLFEIPDDINEVSDVITQDILACSACGRNYRVIEEELRFYKQNQIPIPRACFFCRFTQLYKERGPVHLWMRACQCIGEKSSNGIYQNTVSHRHGKEPCPIEFETSYAPDRPEIVYCESCYNSEIV